MTCFRGHDSDSGNLFELFNLHYEDSLELKQWMVETKKLIWMNPPIFSIICDGTRDISGEQHLSVYFRWVDKDLCPHESFIGLYSVRKTGKHIASVLLDVMVRLHLPISNMNGKNI
ncbi:hypothetical protein PR048_009488 [Dryococelus australis]|uniref:DUF4371 domain-containing protein n=1 Tax=Dryococelus australis TaxID=614101 RepID=A0ABQ9I038_9NEOP|nr:hypothetical protein PR048_009488 [Dryococelus australis]